MKSKQKPREGWHTIGQGSESCGFLELSVDSETAQQSGLGPRDAAQRGQGNCIVGHSPDDTAETKTLCQFRLFHFAPFRSAHHTSGFASQLYQGIL